MGGLGTSASNSTSTPELVFAPGLFSPAATAQGGKPAQDLMNQYLGTMGIGIGGEGMTGTYQQPNPFSTQQVSTTPVSVQSSGFTPSAVNPQVSSIYGGTLQQALLDPSFTGANSPAESALLQKIASSTNAASAARGLGQSSDVELASAIAPTMAQMRQQDIQNLMGANQFDVTSGLGMNQLALQQNLGNIGAGLQSSQQTNAANLGAAQQLLGAQTQQGAFANLAQQGNLAAQQQQATNLMTALGLVAPGASVAENTIATMTSEGKPGASTLGNPGAALGDNIWNPDNLGLAPLALGLPMAAPTEILNQLGIKI